MRAMALIAAFAFTLAGCRLPDLHDPIDCIREADTRPWQQLSSPPPQAAVLKGLVVEGLEAPAEFGEIKRRGEFWYALPTGEIRLCRLAKNDWQETYGAWWEFSGGDNPVIVDLWIWESIVAINGSLHV